MNDESLKHQIAWWGVGNSAPTSACPTEGMLAAYLDGRMQAADQEALEQHVADCSHCVALVGAVIRARRIDDGQVRPGWRRAGQVILAAAAAVALTFSVLLTLRVPEEAGDDARTVRFSRHTAQVPELSFPAGTAVQVADLEIAWTDVPDHLFYELRIVDEDGDLIWTERVMESQWKPPVEAPLRAGVDYFVRVDAYLPDGKPVASRHIPFRLVQAER